MSESGQSRRMRPACFSSDFPFAPGKRQLATKVRRVVKGQQRSFACAEVIPSGATIDHCSVDSLSEFFMLYEVNRHEALSSSSWDAAKAHEYIERVTTDTELRFSREEYGQFIPSTRNSRPEPKSTACTWVRQE